MKKKKREDVATPIDHMLVEFSGLAKAQWQLKDHLIKEAIMRPAFRNLGTGEPEPTLVQIKESVGVANFEGTRDFITLLLREILHEIGMHEESMAIKRAQAERNAPADD